MPMVLICAQIVILSASPAANAAFTYRPTALFLVHQTLAKPMLSRHRGHHIQVKTYREVPTLFVCFKKFKNFAFALMKNFSGDTLFIKIEKKHPTKTINNYFIF